MFIHSPHSHIPYYYMHFIYIFNLYRLSFNQSKFIASHRIAISIYTLCTYLAIYSIQICFLNIITLLSTCENFPFAPNQTKSNKLKTNNFLSKPFGLSTQNRNFLFSKCRIIYEQMHTHTHNR